MTGKDPWLERFFQMALAIGTAILAIDILVGWLTDAFDRDSLSGTVSAIVLNSTLALVTAIAVVGAVYYWRKLRDSERFIIDLADRLPRAKQPEGPPIIADVTDPGYPPLSSHQLADLYADARANGERAYSDAKLCSMAIISVPSERPSIRVQFDFYSEHAGKIAEVHWDNYGGFDRVLAGRDPEPLQEPWGWDEAPWETYPQWEKFYRLAYEKVQPLSDPPRVIITSAFANDRPPWFFQFGHEPEHTPYALTADGQLVRKTSVHAARVALAETFRQAMERRPRLGRE